MFEKVSIFSMAVACGLAILHALLFGGKRAPAESGILVRRYSLPEIFIHTLLVIGFLILAATGFGGAICAHGMDGWTLWIHFAGAGIFTFALTLMMLRWAAENRFTAADWQWLKMFGGYLHRHDRQAPAGRFDCGQKIFFWLSGIFGLACLGTILMSMLPLIGMDGQRFLVKIHRYSALSLVLLTIGHTYISLVAKRGAWRTIINGKADESWVAYFYPHSMGDIENEVKHEA